jgi:hypothetical protein
VRARQTGPGTGNVPLATTVFRDPLAATIWDEDHGGDEGHGGDEERRVTLGASALVLVNELRSPVPSILTPLTSYARSKGTTLNALVNELLKKDIELIETAK